MPAKDDPVVIKKYANRRLYNTGTSTYVTLEDLAEMVKRDEDFLVQDAKTGEDITHSVLTQIIFELENDKNGQAMLPVSFLRQLISFYGDQMQMVVPSFLEQSMKAFAKEQERMREQMRQLISFYGDQMQVVVPSFLEQSMKAFAKEQERMREQMRQAFGNTPMGDLMQMNAPMKMIEEQTRRNMEMFQNALRMFSPVPPAATNGARKTDEKDTDSPDDLKEMREQIAAMQRKIDEMSKD